MSLTGDAARPTLITLPSGHQDGSKKRQFVHLPANQDTSVKSCVATGVSDTSAADLVQRNFKDKALPGQKRMENGLYAEPSASHTEEIPKSTVYRNAFPGDVTTQNDQTWFSKSTNQAFNYTRGENVSHEAIGSQVEGNTRFISAYRKETSGSVASKEINTQNDETRICKPKEDEHHHTSPVDHTFTPTAKTPIALKTGSVHCYPSFGSVATKETTSRRDEVLVQNETFSRLPSSTTSTSTTVPSVSTDEIERERSASQLPKKPRKLPDAFRDKTTSTSHKQDGFYNLDDSLHDNPSRHASSMKVFLTVDDPVIPASDSGPFSIRRLLSSHKPSQKSQGTNASSWLPSHQQRDPKVSKQGHPPGAPSRNSSSLNGGIVRDNNPVEPRKSFIVENMHISTESSQVMNTPSSLSSKQDCGQCSSIVPTSSSFIPTPGRHNSNSLIAASNGKSLDQEHFGMHGTPQQTTPLSFSQSFYKHSEPFQNAGPSNGSSAEKICTTISSRQNPGHTHERKSQPHFHPGVIKIADKTPQNRKLPVATVQAMTTLSKSLYVGSSAVPTRERFNTGHNHSEPPGNRRYSTEKTRNIQQWRHKDPKLQTKHQSYDVEGLHLPGSNSSQLMPSTTSENSDLQAFAGYLTEPESPHIVSAMKEQGLETAFDIGREGQLLEMRKYDSLQTQQVEIFRNQSMRVWTLQSDDQWRSDNPNRMGMTNAPDIYESVTERDILPNYDASMLQNLQYFSSDHSPVDKQYTPVGYTSSTAHLNLQNSLHLQHCPMRQMKQLQLSHRRKRKPRTQDRQHNLT